MKKLIIILLLLGLSICNYSIDPPKRLKNGTTFQKWNGKFIVFTIITIDTERTTIDTELITIDNHY